MQPCNRCQGSAHVHETRIIRGRIYFVAKCNTANCAGGPLTVTSDLHNTAQEAEDAWNRGEQCGDLAKR